MGDASDTGRGDESYVGRLLQAAERRDSTDERMAATIAHRMFRQGEPPRMGRYAVLEVLGEGAMGTVFAAYDPELDRRVAIKVLRRVEGGSEVESVAHARLRKEARALAKLSHPNVVAVYEVGRLEHSLYISMEYVAGVNLRRWLAEHPEAPAAHVLELFAAAGRGLAAAHACGLVHRDFKPDNVLVGEDGRVRVADFGLARIGEATHELSALRSHADRGSSSETTRDDALVGTVAYMAPEQLRRMPSDPRADQFAFCVSLYEALFGARPFTATNSNDQLAAIERAKLEAPHAPGVPSRVGTVLRRGLSIDPDARYPSMLELLSDLVPPASGRGRRRATLAAIGVVAMVALAGGTWAFPLAPADPCEASATHLDGVWDDARATAVQAAFTATDTRHATDAWASSRARLDRYRDDWIEGHREACLATAVHREQSEAVLDRRMACLQRAHDALAAVVDVLAGADASVVHRSRELVDGLPPIARCADLDVLLADVPPPGDPATASAVAEARRGLSRAAALRRAGRYTEAEAALSDVDGEIDYGPLQAEIALERGEIERAHGRFDTAAEAFETALDLTLRWGDWSLARRSAGRLAHIVGDKQHKPEGGLAYARITLGLAMRPSADPGAEAGARHDLATVLLAKGDDMEAEAQLRDAIALFAADPATDDVQIGNATHDLAIVLHRRGRYADAREQFVAALDARRRAYGSWHPQVASSHVALGVVLKALGEYDAAQAEYEQALEVLTKTVGPEHPSTTDALTNLASVLAEQGRREEADAIYRRVLDAQTRALGADHLDVAVTRRLLAGNLSQQGRHVEAEASMRQALEVHEAQLGAEHPDTARVLGNVATILADQGRLAESESLQRLALSRLEAKLDGSDERVATVRVNLGEALLALGRPSEAEAQYRQALASRRASLPPTHWRVVAAEEGLAKALAAQQEKSARRGRG